MAELAPLLVRIQDELTAARRAQHKDELLLLGTVLAEVRTRELDATKPLTDDDIIDVVRKGIKRRRESQQMYESGGRPELAAREAAEAAGLERFLPPAVSDDEIRAAVIAAIAGGAANIGAILGKVMPQFKGRAEGTVINAIAKSELASR
jgi:uncharacterized protein YqeY